MKLKAVDKNKQFLRAYKKGTSYIDSLVVMYVVKNNYGFTRYGITATKKIGNAPKRNRAKRVIRQSIKNLPFDNTKSVDIILVSRTKTPYVKQQYLQKQLENLAKKAGMIL